MTCCVCLDHIRYELRSVVMMSCCGHTLHRGCMQRFLITTSRPAHCMLCRVDIDDDWANGIVVDTPASLLEEAIALLASGNVERAVYERLDLLAMQYD